MDYEKKYKEALEKARFYYGNCPTEPEKKKMETIFPELTESEDERIRQALIDLVSTVGEYYLPKLEVRNKMLAYLERQKEQEHPDGCFTCDEYKKGYEAGRLNGLTAGYNKAKKEQKPAEWSEEDEHRRKDAIYLLESAKRHYADTSEIEKAIDWLKSLRPQPHWKPSEGQMEALLWCTAHLGGADHRVLAELYEHLKKL